MAKNTHSLGRTHLYPLYRYSILFLAVIACIGASRSDAKEIQDVLAQLEEYAEGRMREQKVPGMAYAIVKDDEVIYAKGFGVKKYGADDPVDENTVFEIGSNTKAFGVVVAGMLVDEGAMKWTDKVTDHVSDFKVHESWVTEEFQIEDLMCHRSGMPDYSLDMMWVFGYPVEDVLKALRYVEPVTSFRTSYAYQNVLYIWLGKLIEAKSGSPWPTLVKDRIFTPLGMTQTAAGQTDADMWSNIAVGHLKIDDGTPWGTPWPVPSGWPYSQRVMSSVGPAGNIRSNVLDMARWIRLRLGNGTFEGKTLLKADTMRYIHSPRTLISSTRSASLLYGMGVIYGARFPYPYIWHTGDSLAMYSFVGFIPGVNIGMVVLTNSVGHTLIEDIFHHFYELYFDLPLSGASSSLSLPDRKTEKTMTVPVHSSMEKAPSISRYVGVYKNPAYEKAVVRMEGSSLVLFLGPEMIEGPLSLSGGDTFVWAISDFPGLKMNVTFVRNSSGRVTGLVIDRLHEVNGGKFTKIH